MFRYSKFTRGASSTSDWTVSTHYQSPELENTHTRTSDEIDPAVSARTLQCVLTVNKENTVVCFMSALYLQCDTAYVCSDLHNHLLALACVVITRDKHSNTHSHQLIYSI